MHKTTLTYPTGTARGVRFLSGAAMTQQQPPPELDFPALVAELVRQGGMDYGEAAAYAAKEHPDAYAAHRTRTATGSR